jgi:hypothetical protein
MCCTSENRVNCVARYRCARDEGYNPHEDVTQDGASIIRVRAEPSSALSSAPPPMSTQRPDASYRFRPWITSLAALAIAALSGACGDAQIFDHSAVDKSRRNPEPEFPIEVESVWVTLTAPDASRSQFSIDARGTRTATIAFGHLAPGPYDVSFSAETTDGAACDGGAMFDVAPSTAISVGFTVRCAP